LGILNKNTNWLEIITIVFVIVFFSTMIVIAALSTEESRAISRCKLECGYMPNDTPPILIDEKCYCDPFYDENGEILNKTNNTNG